MTDLMDWPEAVDALVGGLVVAREAWGEDQIVVFVNGCGRSSRGPLESADLMADDWFCLGPLQ